jgi:heme/copper-type cytochrome/quinol oxidase subunit 2
MKTVLPSNPATKQLSNPILTLLLLLAAPPAFACPVCFGNATGPQAEGMNSAIIFLLGVVGFVQIGFAAMFIAFWRRGRAARRHRDSFRVIHGG